MITIPKSQIKDEFFPTFGSIDPNQNFIYISTPEEVYENDDYLSRIRTDGEPYFYIRQRELDDGRYNFAGYSKDDVTDLIDCMKDSRFKKKVLVNLL